MYNFYIPNYGFDNLMAYALECAMKKLSATKLGDIIADIQKFIDDAVEVAEKVDKTALLTANIVDELLGIGEEVRDRYDATKKFANPEQLIYPLLSMMRHFYRS